MIRAFFAMELDADLRRAAGAQIRALRRRRGADAVRWVSEENLHVTLRFFGEIDPERVPELTDRVGKETAALPPFAMWLGELGAFPPQRGTRSEAESVIVLEMEPVAPIAALAEAVDRGVTAAGFPPETRPFRPHLTLGRRRIEGPRLVSASPKGAQQGNAERSGKDDVTGSDTGDREACDVKEAVLFRSELLPSGARYTPLARIGLARVGLGSTSPQTVHPRKR